VLDLADAHLAALELTGSTDRANEPPEGPSRLLVCNLGSGSGYSVREVLEASQRVVGRSIPHAYGPRRAGDPPVLVASNDRAQALLSWAPRLGTLDEMIGSAWRWRVDHRHGYAD
jgi:UDP-glucose 4-epimerase